MTRVRYFAAAAEAAGVDAEERHETSLEALRAAVCLLYTSPSPRDVEESRMPSSA